MAQASKLRSESSYRSSYSYKHASRVERAFGRGSQRFELHQSWSARSSIMWCSSMCSSRCAWFATSASTAERRRGRLARSLVLAGGKVRKVTTEKRGGLSDYRVAAVVLDVAGAVVRCQCTELETAS